MKLNPTRLKNIIFFVCLTFSVSAFSQTIIKSQSFDSGASGYSDDLNHDAPTFGSITSTTAESSPNSYQITGSHDDETNLYFDNVDLSGYNSVSVTISFSGYNLRKNEDLEIGLSYDDGSSYNYTKLIDGNNEAAGAGQTINWGNTDSDGAVPSSNPYTISISDSESSVKISIRAKKLDSGDFFYIDNILIQGIVAVPSYCSSTGDTDYVTGVTGVIFNTIDNTGQDINEFNDYTDFTNLSTDVIQGSPYDLEVYLNTSGNWTIYSKVWIDWNHDYDFDDTGEEYDLGFATNGDEIITSNSALEITVPAGATLGETRMRVSAKYNGYPSNCGSFVDGEVEDYTINVIASTPAPIIDVVGNSTTLTDGQTAISTGDDTDFGTVNPTSGSATHIFTIENNGNLDLNTISVSLTGDSEFTLDTSSTDATVSSGGTTTFAITFDSSAEATFTGVVSITSNDTDSSPYTFTIKGLGALYCESYGNSDNDMGISRIIIGDIDNATSTSTATHSDYTAMSTSIEQGDSEDITVQIDTDGHYSLFATVWIDWNQDGDFDDTDESHNVGYAHNGDENTIDSPYSIVAPVDAVVGSTRMRIASKWVGSANEFHDGDYDPNDPEEHRPSFDPCETGLDGEVEDYTITVTARTPMIDFDGIDDYVDFGDSHDLTGNFSIEAWILQEQTVTNGSILSKGDLDSSNGSKDYGYVLAVENGEVTFNTFNNGGQSTVQLSSSPYTITNNKWYHVAVSYNGTSAILYIDGILIDSDGTNSSLMNNSESFYIGAYYDSDSVNPTNYFDGFIDEVKIWDVGLSQTQIQEMMNQEIEQNGSGVKGKIITKDISDDLDWINLIGYYNFNDDSATDQSDSGIDGLDVNISTSQLQTAPLPYYTMQDGNWDSADSTTPWQYRETVWNTPNSVGIDGSTNIDWNIVRVSHNLDVNRDLYLGSLISESTALLTDEEITDSELTMGSDGGDYELNISHYLKLDGKLDLQNESQLIQGDGSWLDVDSSGYAERDQQGTANSYTYNYWSSPVSFRNITENNKEHKSGDVLRDGHQGGDVVSSLDFDPDSTSSIDAYYADGSASNPRKAATYWMYKFVNSQGNNYTNWEWVGNYYDIKPTEGFTMKGTSGSGNIDMNVESQNYVFRGKPNNVLNGDTEIVHTTFDSSFDSSGNPKISLAGNPFLSAIDADAFIDDNVNSMIGQIYFWEHWGGGTHKWSQYQGGYSIYTKAGGVAAVSHSDVSQIGSGSKTPQQYIPVGQGFYVIQKHDYDSINNIPSNPQGGNIVFKNSQRIFKTEASGESIFTKGIKNKESKEGNSKNTIQRIRLEFKSPDGFVRPVLAAFTAKASNKIDQGFDGIAGDFLKNDAFFYQNNRYLVINALSTFNEQKELPISIFIDKDGQGGIQEFSLKSTENFDKDIRVYVKDHHNNGETYEITNSTFEIELEPGEHKDRFSLVFQSKLLDFDELKTVDEGFQIYFGQENSEINIKKLADIDAVQVTLMNSLGQTLKTWNQGLQERHVRLPVNLSTGVYILNLKTNKGNFTKKMMYK